MNVGVESKSTIISGIIMLWFIIAVITCAKRKKLKQKYDVGYFSSGITMVCLLSPVIIGIPAFFDPKMQNRNIAMIMSVIYPTVALVIYLFLTYGEPTGLRIKRLFVMLFIGISLGVIIPVEMIVENMKYKGDTYRQPYSGENLHFNSDTKEKEFVGSKTFTDSSGRTTGYMSENGYLTNAIGKHIGNVYPDGRIENEVGKTVGYWNKDGMYITDAVGRVTGHFDENGTITNSVGKTTGHVI